MFLSTSERKLEGNLENVHRPSGKKPKTNKRKTKIGTDKNNFQIFDLDLFPLFNLFSLVKIKLN